MAKTTRPRKATPAKRQPAPAQEPARDAKLADIEREADEQAAVARDGAASTTDPTPAVPGEHEADTPVEPAPAAPPPASPKRAKNPRLCPVPDCDRLGHDHLLGLCGAHYASRRGDHV